MNIENCSLGLARFGRGGCLLKSIKALKWRVIGNLFCVALFSSHALAQERPALTLNQISELLKGGVSAGRVAQLVEQRGVNFELNESATKRLRADGADQALLSTVQKLAARYADEQRRKGIEEAARQKAAEERKRDEATAQRLEATRRQLLEKAQKREAEKRIPEDPKSRSNGEALQKPQQGTGATLMAQEDVGRVASLRNVVITEDGEVSGVVANGTKNTLRDVQLQIVYSWRWKNEHKPGTDDPGTARYHVLKQDIPPSQTLRFNYKPSPPLASRTDGQFDITVKVVGLAQVVQPAAQ